MKAIAEESTISNTAVLRQALVQFLDQPEDQIAPYIERDYGDCTPFTNIYCSPDTVANLDALTEKFDKSRNQVIRGAVEKYLESQKKGEIAK